MFQDASLLKIAFDRLQDFKPSARENSTAKLSTYQKRLERTAQDLNNSSLDDTTLRLMLWAEMRSALDCPSAAPLSLRSASTSGSDLTSKAAKILGSLVEPETANPNSKNIDVLRR